jgi:hypothetical protein
MPTAPVQQAFSRGLEQLLPFYQESLPASRVQVFGGEGHQKSFIADFREADVALWKSYGWDLQIDCRDGLSPQSYKVPTLLLDKRLFFGLSTCPNLGEYTFTSTWVAETTELSLRLFGRVRANVDCPTGSLAEEVGPTSASVKFKVRSGDRLVITLSTDDPSASAHLHQVQGEIAKIPKMQTCARSSK